LLKSSRGFFLSYLKIKRLRKNINIKEIVENNYKGFSYGDMTSVAVSPNGEKLAVAIQSSDYSAAGCLAVFLCGADGTLSFDQIYEAGVQPDMVTFTPDSKKILSADEGEPRNGYEAGSIDPKGTVTVIDLTNQNVSHLDFTVFDSEAKRAELVQNGVILKKGTAPSVDLEPEYIAANDKTAYVTLQEANAIAIVDLQTLSIENICSAGYEDYEKYPIDIDKKDAAYRPVSYPSLRGIRMPDGISLFESNGKTYIVTANEGDSREWNEYLNEAECNFGKGQTSPSGKITAENSGLTGKVVFFDQNDYEGLNSEYDYLFGGRSFTVYCVDGSGMKEVYTSGNELEAKTAAYFPQYFNCSNDSAEIDDRSGKKGVEAESVTIGTVGEKTYAFIGLERIGGVMAYDITNPDKILFANYINSRDFSKDIAGDVSPEGLCMISASESADGNAYLLASCEVSGTVAAYKLISQNIDSSDDDNTDNNHDNNIDHNGSGHGGADTEDLNNQESKTNALKTGDHAPVIGTGIGMVLALSAIIVILKYRRSKNTITNTK
uniref:choice-of-anchor I family protein n=1 Tax=[Ruminococcus] torques TaxID=33039 RepID=UPI00266050E8